MPDFITPLPPAPSRDDPPDIFVPKANAFVASLENFVVEINAFIASLGDAGSEFLSYEAAQDLDAYAALRPSFDSKADYADSDSATYANSVLGISVISALTGTPIQIQYKGEIVNPGWSWVENEPIFCGPAGSLTQTAPTSGFQLIVGIAVAPTKMVVGIKQPILL